MSGTGVVIIRTKVSAAVTPVQSRLWMLWRGRISFSAETLSVTQSLVEKTWVGYASRYKQLEISFCQNLFLLSSSIEGVFAYLFPTFVLEVI